MNWFSAQRILVLLAVIHLIYGANILGLLSGKSTSHFIWNKALIDELVRRGHNVTMMSEEPILTKLPDNFHYIYLEDLNPNFAKFKIPPDVGDNIRHHLVWNNFKLIPFIYDYFMTTCNDTLLNHNFNILLNYPDNFKFDLIIFDFTMGPCTLGFLHKFNYPRLVGITAFNNPPDSVDYAGGHWHPAYIPFYSTSYSTDMNYFQRIHNMVLYIYDYIYRYTIFLPKLDKLIRTKFPTDMPYVADLMPRAELILVNIHPATHLPQPVGPNVIEVGGLHIADPKPVENSIQSFMNSSKKGTVYISLGTVVSSESIGSERCNIILEVIKSFPEYNFLWKIKSEYLNNPLPKNLMTKDWFIQNDILAHPSIRAFITHGGTLSLEEATAHGVPLVGMPVLVDQYRNVRTSVHLGVAMQVDVLTLTEDKLHEALKTVLTNKKYKENMIKRSKHFRDRPMKPLDSAAWWIEYVLRHEHLEHLKSPAINLGIWKSNSFDVIFTFACIIAVFVWIFVLIFRKILTLMGKQKSKYETARKLKST